MNARVLNRLALIGATVLPFCALSSRHREAPAIAGQPRVDGTDFYMFRSYEPGRSAYTTLIANYIPLQDAYGGPDYFSLDPNAVYQIHVDNDGDADSDLTFEFKFTNTVKDLTVNAGGRLIPIPLINSGPIDTTGATLNVKESYSVTVDRHGYRQIAGNGKLGGSTFYTPPDNIGNKTIADYDGYAGHFIYEMNIPGCPSPAKVFGG